MAARRASLRVVCARQDLRCVIPNSGRSGEDFCFKRRQQTAHVLSLDKGAAEGLDYRFTKSRGRILGIRLGTSPSHHLLERANPGRGNGPCRW